MSKDATKQAWALGGTIFAAMTLVVVGCFQVIMGISAIFQDEIFVTGQDYTYTFDTTLWGWVHAGIGVVMFLTGVALFSRSNFARALGISFAVVSAVVNFAFIPYYPLWAIMIIAMDIFAIWSMATVSDPRPTRHIPPAEPATGQRPQQDWSHIDRESAEPAPETDAKDAAAKARRQDRNPAEPA